MTLSGMAQTIGDAFYIYRSDGQFNAFFRDEVISIDYSYEDADGNTYDEIVTQIVNTADSVYKIPLAAIDSVCFVTPPTVYKQDVTRMELNLLDYIIGADSLTLKLKPGTPSQIIPVIGDKLILLEGCDVLPNGFSGIVSNVHNGSISIDVVCEQAYLEDLFDSFCSASTVYGSSPDAEYASRAFSTNGSHRVTYNPDDVVYSLGPYKIDRSYEVSQGIAFNGDLALTGGASFSVEIQPTLKIHTFLILGEGQGTYFQYRISGDLRVTSQSSLYGGLSYNHDFEGREIKCPIPQTGNTVNFYFNPGLFVRADATITASLTSTQIYTFGSAFDFSSKGQNTLKPSIGGRLASSSVDMSGCLDGNLAGGAYAEIGFNLLSRELAKVCVRGELGARFSGSFVFRNSDIDNATKDTKLYERLKASNIELSSFVNASLQASVAHTGNGLTWELSEPIHTWDRVPTFANTSFKQKLNPHTSADASTQLSGDCLIPVMAGLSVRDKNGNEVDDYYPSTAFDKGDKPLSYTFTNLSSDEDYTLYPKVRIFGYEMLASPSAKQDKTEMPVKITDFKQTDSHYEKDAFTNDGQKYSYKYDCAVTVELTNSEGVEDWGYVYKDPFGNPSAIISLKGFDSPYTDTRYSYYRSESSSTVTLYEYVRYAGDNGYYYGAPKDYQVTHKDKGVTACPDNNHPHWIDLDLPSGTKWACCNEGASTPEGYGGYFAFGQSWVPTAKQIQELLDYSTSVWTTVNGVNGRILTGSNGGTIFLPAAKRNNDGEYENYGQYWSSTTLDDSSYPYSAYFLSFSSQYIGKGQATRNNLFSVRPVLYDNQNIKVITETATEIGISTATLWGHVETDTFGGVGIVGFIYSNQGDPRIYGGTTVTAEFHNDYSNGRFYATISDLIEESNYYFVAFYQTGKDHIHYGEVLSFTTIKKQIISYLTCPDDNHPHLIDLGLPSGTKWACCNVGATKPEDDGGYYAWGETSEKDIYNVDTYKWREGTKITKYCTRPDNGPANYYGNDDNRTILEPTDDAATSNWGLPWHMPTKEQFEELIENTTSEKITIDWWNNIYGRVFTGNNGGKIILPAARGCLPNRPSGRNETGLYWSSSLRANYPYDAYYFLFQYNWKPSVEVMGVVSGRENGLSVRAVQ